MAGGTWSSYFTETIFSGRMIVRPSSFIRAMHPKTQIVPSPSSIERILKAGWVGQLKIHGHRAQIHVPSDPDQHILAYTRQGRRHTQALSPTMVKELYRLFRPSKGWNVIDAEWLKKEKKLFVFDLLMSEGKVLRLKTFPQRFKMLPRDFLSPHIQILPILSDLSSCMKAMESSRSYIEGLVFKSTTSIGFSDTSIVRCRKKPY